MTDSASVVSQRLADSLQIALLERDVSSLTTWLTALGVGLGLVAVLFAAGAIVAAVLLWRQSTEYKRLIDNELLQYRDLLENVLGNARRDVESAVASIREKEATLSAQLSSAGAERKAEIDAELAKLRGERETLEDLRGAVGRIDPSELEAPDALQKLRSRSVAFRNEESIYDCTRCNKIRRGTDVKLGVRNGFLHAWCGTCGSPLSKLGVVARARSGQ